MRKRTLIAEIKSSTGRYCGRRGTRLKVLEEQGLHSLFYDLESNGVSFEKGGSCSLREVCKILNDLFGYEAADLGMERI